MQLHSESYGQGEPLLLLHGLFGSLENWRAISHRLAGDFRVIAADLPNHGRSPHTYEMSFQTMAEDLKETIEALGLQQAHVAGHSLGGKVAMAFALLYPARVRKLVVVDIAPRAYAGRHQSILKALRALDLSQFSQRNQLERALAPDIPDLATRRFLLKNVVRDAAGAFHWRLGLEQLWSIYSRLGEAVTNAAPFQGQALFLRGERSDYLLPEDFPQIRSLFPNAEFGSIPKAGHLPHTENPEAFVQQVRTFLARR